MPWRISSNVQPKMNKASTCDHHPIPDMLGPVTPELPQCLDRMKIVLAVISKENRSRTTAERVAIKVSNKKGSRLLRSWSFRAMRILPVASGSVVGLEESWIKMRL